MPIKSAQLPLRAEKLRTFNQRKFFGGFRRGCQASQRKGLTSGEVQGTSGEPLGNFRQSLETSGQPLDLESRKWGVRSLVVEIGVFGAPRFSVQRSQNPLQKAFGDLWTEHWGAPNSTTTDLTPHLRPSDGLLLSSTVGENFRGSHQRLAKCVSNIRPRLKGSRFSFFAAICFSPKYHWSENHYTQLLPSDTKVLLTKNYSKIIISRNLTNLTRNSLKMPFFPGHFESPNCLRNYEK